MWSVVGSPLFTDDARRERPADHDQQMQGGLPKAKPTSSTRRSSLSTGDGSHIHSLGRPVLPESTAVSRFEAAEYASQYLPNVVEAACRKFEIFHHLSPGTATADMVDAQSSLKVPGWASAPVVDWSFIDSERRAFELYAEEQSMRRTHSCYAFGNADTASGAGEAAEEHNDQVARIINMLGESGAGRRAVLRAIAQRQGIDDDDEIDDRPPGNEKVP